MSYRKIVVDGIEYKWKVGRSNIEIRNNDTKFIVDRPEAAVRYGVIYSDVDVGGLRIEIFPDEESAQRDYESRKSYSASPELELVKLPRKTVAITPQWIESAIRSKHQTA